MARHGWETIAAQAEKIVRERLAPAAPLNDGRQTPMRGHPVFVAQHATATCCRGCLAKWHGIPAGRPLSDAEIARVVAFQLAWIREAAGDLSGLPRQDMLGISGTIGICTRARKGAAMIRPQVPPEDPPASAGEGNGRPLTPGRTDA